VNPAVQIEPFSPISYSFHLAGCGPARPSSRHRRRGSAISDQRSDVAQFGNAAGL